MTTNERLIHNCLIKVIDIFKKSRYNLYQRDMKIICFKLYFRTGFSFVINVSRTENHGIFLFNKLSDKIINICKKSMYIFNKVD